MASAYGNYPSNGNLRLYIVVERISSEEDNNRSLVRYRAYMTRTASNGFRYWNLNNTFGWIDRNGTGNRLNRTMSGYDFNMGVGSNFWLSSSTWLEMWVPHNSDGTKTTNFRAYHNGDNSSVGSVTTPWASLSLPTLYQAIAVSSFSIDNITTESVRLNVSCNRTANRLEWSINGGAWQAVARTFTSTTQTITGLTPGTSYGFRVRVRRSSNNNYSPASGTLNRSTNAVTLDTVNDIETTDVGFKFNIVAAYLCDRLEYRVDGGSWQTIDGDFTSSEFDIGQNLRSGREYNIDFRGRHKDSQTNTPIVSRTVTTGRQNNFFGIVKR